MKKTVQILGILMTLSILFISCKKIDVPNGTPNFVKKQIRKNDCLRAVYKVESDIGRLYLMLRTDCLVDRYEFCNEKGETIKKCQVVQGNDECSISTDFVESSRDKIWDSLD